MTHFNDHGPWYENQEISYQSIVRDIKTLFKIENDESLEYLINQAFLEISEKVKSLYPRKNLVYHRGDIILLSDKT